MYAERGGKRVWSVGAFDDGHVTLQRVPAFGVRAYLDDLVGALEGRLAAASIFGPPINALVAQAVLPAKLRAALWTAGESAPYKTSHIPTPAVSSQSASPIL